MTKLVRIDKYTNDDKVPTPANIATYRYISIFNDDDTIDSIIQRAKNGFIDSDKKSILYYEGDKMPPIGEEEATEDNPNREPAGSSKGGQFASKDGGTGEEFVEQLKKDVTPKKKQQRLQKEVADDVTEKVWNEIDKLGVRDKVHDVAMQGSYEKGTDLASSGSDLDLFIVFNSNVPEKERAELGFEIGMNALEGKEPYEQNATTRYAEAKFYHPEDPKNIMEVQVVPTRHLTLEQIRTKTEEDGTPIKSIGMERTPHQTAYMKKALVGKTEEVRMLKQFMKDTGLYDSSMKSQGFSGYSAEVLIDNKGSFENVLKFFATLKEGDIVDKFGGGKRNGNNLFSLIDPIDPNRDLISAFSPMKIGRTIKTAKHFLEHGSKIDRSKDTVLNSVTVKFNNTENNEDTLVGETNKTQNGIIKQLNRMGFNIEINRENVNGMDIEIPRSKMNELDGEVSLTFGIKDYNIPEEFSRELDPSKVDISKVNARIEKLPSGKVNAWYQRPFTNVADALKHITTTNVESSRLSKYSIQDMKKGVRISTKDKDEFENLI